MRIHREGNGTLIGIFIFLLAINTPIFYWSDSVFLKVFIAIISIILFIFTLQFFRYPSRKIEIIDDNKIICPCDGKVVVIEPTEEQEYFKEKRLQISIFMSPLNVHINWYPVSGVIKYFKYFKGKYLVAWHPKSSTENERTSMVIRTKKKKEILLRQIAGAVARRLVFYSTTEDEVKQGDELGFIKFGSRIDLFLPMDVKIKVKLNEVVTGNETIIAKF